MTVDPWDETLKVLNQVPIAAPTAVLLKRAETKWRDKVIPRSSMADVFFTLPDERFPWRNIVRVSRNSPTRFEIQLSLEEVPIRIDRATEADAPAMLDAFLTELTADCAQ